MSRIVPTRDHEDAARALVDARRMFAKHGDLLRRSWTADRLDRYGPGAAVPSHIALAHAIEDLNYADPVWMTHEMMDLVQVAMEGFDPTEPMIGSDVFIPAGFMVLPEPFYGLDVSGKRRIAWQAIAWRYVPRIGEIDMAAVGARTHVAVRYDDVPSEPLVNGTEVDGVRFLILAPCDVEDDFPLPAEDVEWSAQVGMRWLITHATTMPLPLVGIETETRGEGDRRGAWLQFWRVALRLMSETVVMSTMCGLRRPARRELARLGHPIHETLVVELRRPSWHVSDPERERVTDVDWSHRWLVRGHWRNQWYPSEGVHRQKFIGGYVKGPENLPLVIKQRVWNWDR